MKPNNQKFTLGGGQNFERRNVERLKFRNFKVVNIKITKDELFDSFIFEYSKYVIIFQIVKYWFSWW